MQVFYRQYLMGGVIAYFLIASPGQAFGTNETVPAVKSSYGNHVPANVELILKDGAAVSKLHPFGNVQPLVPAMVAIPAGCFQMGSPTTEIGRSKDEKLHRVCVKSFKLGQNEVTVGEFNLFVEATGFKTDADHNTVEYGCWSYEKKSDHPWDWRAWANWKQPIQGTYPLKNYPVTCVSYHDVMAYIDWLNEATGHLYRLPTEAEWEYAARAGTSTAYFWGNNPGHACSYANVADASTSGPFKWPEAYACEDGHFFTAAVKSFSANAFNLYDMLGNVWEWSCSHYEENYKGEEQKCLSENPAEDVLIVSRGGGWNANAERVRSAHRNWGVAWSRQANLGFRLVRVR
jgi:sulfatase modifying factor 1